MAAFLRLYPITLSCLAMHFFRFSYAELRSFLNMFYEEEEREADRIRTKFLLIKRRLQRQLEPLERKREEEDSAAASQEGESLC